VRICGTQGVSAIDFPGRVSTVVFLGGCNFRCPFCQNPDLVLNPGSMPALGEDDFIADITRKKGFIDGVVVTGGEPLINGEQVLSLLRRIKDTGLAVKLDTNGYEVEVLEEVFLRGLVDYVAMDAKTSLEKYGEAVAMPLLDTNRIVSAIGLVQKSGVAHEFRTTCVPGLVDEDDVSSIAQMLGPSEDYYLQQFRPGPDVIDRAYSVKSPYPPARLSAFADAARPYVRSVSIRGV